VFAVLVYWELVSLPCPLPLEQGQRSISQLPAVTCYAGLLIVFNFAMSFDFGFCSPSQEMSL
jgi:hypothetical protein